MENKELNKKIYFALLDLAKEQFKGLDLPEGHYTANDVYKTLVERLETEEKEVTDKNGVTDTIKVYTKESLQKTEFEEISICVDSFKCRIKNALGLFQALSGYEKLCGCSGAKAYIFQVEKEESGKITTTITFEIPTSKEWNALKKCACTDNLRPVLNGIFADAENKNLVSTDGIVLYICNADISGDRNILIPLDICKKLKSGKVTVSIYEEYEKETEENYTVNGIICSRTNKETITPVKVENNGLSYTFEDKGLRYPDYIKVANYNEVDKDFCINIDIKEFEKTAKQCAKLVPAYCPLQLHAEKSTSGLEMGVKHEYPKIERRTQIDANNTPGRSITFGLELEQLLKILPVCSGNIYYKDHSRPVIFDSVNNGTLLIMPRLIDNSIFEDTGIIKDEFETPALERFEKYGYDTYMKPKKKAKAKKVSIITNEEKEAAKPAKAIETVEPEKPSFDYSKAAKNIVEGLIDENTLLVGAYKGLNEQLQRNEETKAIRPKETAINDIKNEEPDATELLPDPPKWIYYDPDDQEPEEIPKYNDFQEPEKETKGRMYMHIYTQKQMILRYVSSVAAALIIFLCGWFAGAMTKDTSAKAQKAPIPATFRIYEPASVVHKANKPQIKAVNTLKVQKHINYNVKHKKPLKTKICKNDNVTAKAAVKRMQPDSIRITDTNLHPDVLPGACINDSVNNIVITINFKN